ncbi:DNA-binding response regulator [Photobacterium sp. OFAV2-7]|uniref:response regulator transcription factor n=1 Tax=Photobacterium sp. OFAV2-7 TaxID=2917748 RepID=UPI001EF6248C|nr:response regulator transcription factor [Photobacterium sp. OFAV2-7]MCG7584970.1 response regulator transcription factor [Photobacterium sp. OFAV2-7]
MLRIMLVEDQTMLLGTMATLLDMYDDFSVVKKAKDGAEATEYLVSNPVDIIITDLEMPNKTGLELAEEVKHNYPSIKVIVVTTFSRSGYLKRALDCGVKGYLLKDSPFEELVDAIRRVHKGETVVESDLAIAALTDKDPLTDKERKILRLVGNNLSNKEIASTLFLGEGTVRNYISISISKLNASNRVDAYRIAKESGWL